MLLLAVFLIPLFVLAMAAFPCDMAALLRSPSSAPPVLPLRDRSFSSARPGGHKNYGQSEMNKAVKEYVSGEGGSYNEVAAMYDVPATTLYDHVQKVMKGEPIKPNGRPRVLDMDDEQMLFNWLNYQANVAMPTTKELILEAAAKLAAARGSRKFRTASGLPGKRWWAEFTKRWKLQQKHIKKVDPKRPTRSEYDEWIHNLTMTIINNHITIDRLYNADESGIDRRYGSRAYVVVQKGKQQVGTTIATTFREHVTVVVSVCANGTFLPPTWIAQGKGNLSFAMAQKMLTGTLPGSSITQTRKGWIETDSWSEWLQLFVQQLPTRPTAEHPVLLLLDGHQTRYSWQCLEFAMAHHVLLFLLPPHMTALLQPLDVGVFGIFKVDSNSRSGLVFLLKYCISCC